VQLLELTVAQLLDNAVKYSRPASAIDVTVRQEEEFITLRVRNEGNSIPNGERDRIFERFYRGASVRNLVSGSGLGLYVARKIAAAHGGSLILINDDGDSGVIFSLKLPSPEPSSFNPESNHEHDSLVTAL
jgi:two-component system sensor histidine kinase KdpD